ncbi:MAG TPA: universal stress protein [Solirubrobacteraceae bacterium]|nr:universal stress protein [Solirubrobacteraceae bacterium]
MASVLICYDGSERAAHAIAVTALLFPGARAHVLNVWEPMERIVARYSALGPYLGEGIGEADTGIEREATALAEAGAKLATDAGLVATPRTAALRTSVWEAVVNTSDELDVDAIITGTRSLHGVREALSNTLSHALLQHSQRPVLAIPTPPAE